MSGDRCNVVNMGMRKERQWLSHGLIERDPDVNNEP